MERHEHSVRDLIDQGGEAAGREASQKWARVFDGLLCSLFCALRHQAGDEKTWKTLSLAAVGSYGRGNFSFRSDLDVRILCSKPKLAGEIAEAILYPLWDAGLEIGHQVVTVPELISLAKTDLPTATTLLDWRSLAGDSVAPQKLKAKAFETVFSSRNVHSFLTEMNEQAWEREKRFGDSVYLLEPDVKNGRGGVRDFDILCWTAQARWRVQNLQELLNIGILVPAEFEQLQEAQAYLARVRNLLHFSSKRRTDRLGFESQEIVAEKLGYGTGGAACERLMSEYYRHARVVANARDSLLRRAELPSRKKQKEEDVGGGILVRGGAIAIASTDALAGEPVLVLRAYWEAIQRDMTVEVATRDAITRSLMDPEICKALRSNSEAARLFRRMIRMPRRVLLKRNSTLSEFHDVGLLLAMIPEFAPVVGRVHHDIYHVYTVDVHSIAAVDRLRKYARGELAEDHPVASRLAADLARPQVLYMAALLHDIGKDIGGRSHSERGYEICRPILERLGVQEHDIVEIQHLVLKHLRMYHVASRRDIDDPQTIEHFRHEVRGPEGLKELYLLTLCDVATTSPHALTSWKTRMMEELYVSALRSFDGLPLHSEERAENLRSSTRALCPEKGEAEFLEHFLKSVPDRYMYANEPDQIVGHARLARQSERRRHVVELLGTRAAYVELGFVIDDKPGALAVITAAMAANRMRVIGAQLYSWADRKGRKRVLDIFWVMGGRDPGETGKLIPRLRDDIERLASGEVEADTLLESRFRSGLSERPSPDVPVRINFDNRSSGAYTVIEVVAEDRAGLLYCLAKALKNARLQIALAKINTEGNQATDIFYVADQEGNKLLDTAQLVRLDKDLRAALPQSSALPTAP